MAALGGEGASPHAGVYTVMFIMGCGGPSVSYLPRALVNLNPLMLEVADGSACICVLFADSTYLENIACVLSNSGLLNLTDCFRWKIISYFGKHIFNSHC